MWRTGVMVHPVQLILSASQYSWYFPGKSYFIGIIFNAYREMRKNSGNLEIGTKVINAIVSPPTSDNLSEPVEMTFQKRIVSKLPPTKCGRISEGHRVWIRAYILPFTSIFFYEFCEIFTATIHYFLVLFWSLVNHLFQIVHFGYKIQRKYKFLFQYLIGFNEWETKKLVLKNNKVILTY